MKNTNAHGVVEEGKDVEDADPTIPHSLNEVIELLEMIDLAGEEYKLLTLNEAQFLKPLIQKEIACVFSFDRQP
ncbi:hypothetical protein G8C15_14170 [Enterococcus casseliflavus]|nr:hypothetical protein [Enterococcus casseliflavus]